MMPFIANAARVLATSTRAASVKGAQAAAAAGKNLAKGATVESKAIDKFVKLNEKLSKSNRRDNKDNLTYMQKMENSVAKMQRNMDNISKSSKNFVNNIKMLVGLGGVGGMLYSFLKITESYGSPSAKFRGKVTATSLRDQKAFEQMLAVKGINKPDLLDRLGMAATESSVIGTTANKFFSRFGINSKEFLGENSAGRLDMILEKWDMIKHIPTISKFFEEFLGMSWSEINALRSMGDLKQIYNEKSKALKDTNLYRFSNLHESLENIKQNVLNGLVKVFDKLAPTIEKVSRALGEGLVKVIDWLATKFKDWNAEQWGDAIISVFEKIEKIINFLSSPLDTLKKMWGGSDTEEDKNLDKAISEAKTKEEKEQARLEKIKSIVDEYSIFTVSKNIQRSSGLAFAKQIGLADTPWAKWKNASDNFWFKDMTVEDKINDVINFNLADLDKRLETFRKELIKQGETIELDEEALKAIRHVETRDFLLDIAKTNYNKKFEYAPMAAEYDRLSGLGFTPTQIMIKIINDDINQQSATIQSNKQ